MRRALIALATVSVLGLVLSACNMETQAYKDACAADTPDAYETYIANYPTGLHISDIRYRLDEADWKAAEEADSAAAYQTYVDKHADGAHIDDARAKAKSKYWDEAEAENTLAALKDYKKRYGTGAAALRVDKRIAALEYAATGITIADVALERADISGAGGEPNGWKVTAVVTNTGDRTIDVLKVRVAYLDANGAFVGHRMEFVATPTHPMGLPLSDEVKKPMATGDARNFVFSFGDDYAPEGWQADLEHIKVEVTELEGEAPAE